MADTQKIFCDISDFCFNTKCKFHFSKQTKKKVQAVFNDLSETSDCAGYIEKYSDVDLEETADDDPQ